MDYVDIVRIETALGQNGAWYQQKINLSGTDDSDAILLPFLEIYSIGIQFTGDVEIYATAYKKEDIESDDAVWDLWDGVSDFNLAITAIKVENQSGSSETIITVKTSEV